MQRQALPGKNNVDYDALQMQTRGTNAVKTMLLLTRHL